MSQEHFGNSLPDGLYVAPQKAQRNGIADEI